MLGPDSVAAKLMLNPLTLLGGPRALLLQLAHPLVAAGVADHSSFQQAPFDRLLRTLSTLGTVAFASPQASGRALHALSDTHRTVRGRSPEGRAYSAGDPRLATWVHATIVDSYLAVDRRWVGCLQEDERSAFYRETLILGRAFGARVTPDANLTGPEPSPERSVWRLPASLAGFEAWMGERMGELVVSEQARAMALDVMRPPLCAQWGALGRERGALGRQGEWLGRQAERLAWPFMEVVTADLLPLSLRDGYGLGTPMPHRRQPAKLALGATCGIVRQLSPLAQVGGPHPDRPTRVAAFLSGCRIGVPHQGTAGRGQGQPRDAARRSPLRLAIWP